MGYGFVNFRTSASCDEFISRPLPRGDVLVTGGFLKAGEGVFFKIEM